MLPQKTQAVLHAGTLRLGRKAETSNRWLNWNDDYESAVQRQMGMSADTDGTWLYKRRAWHEVLPHREPPPSPCAASNRPRTSARVRCDLLLGMRSGAMLLLGMRCGVTLLVPMLGQPAGGGAAVPESIGRRSEVAAPPRPRSGPPLLCSALPPPLPGLLAPSVAGLRCCISVGSQRAPTAAGQVSTERSQSSQSGCSSASCCCCPGAAAARAALCSSAAGGTP